MAVTAAAARLTEAHRLAQHRLGARTVAAVVASWRALDPADIDPGLRDWLRIVVPIVQANRSSSATLASNYLMTFRSLELGVAADRFVPALADIIDQQALITSMTVTGPATLKRAIGRGLTLTKATDLAQATSARAAMRHALNGGRETIAVSVDADRQAVGYARVASGNACAFCAMLASRGPVFTSALEGQLDSDLGDYHDGCNCTVEPAYSEDADWPAGSQRYHDLWQEATAGHSGKDAINAFRSALAS